MNEGNRIILAEITGIKDGSFAIQQHIELIASGFSVIETGAASVSTATKKIVENIQSMEAAVAHFKT
jgi:hypothetical protein